MSILLLKCESDGLKISLFLIVEISSIDRLHAMSSKHAMQYACTKTTEKGPASMNIKAEIVTKGVRLLFQYYDGLSKGGGKFE